MHLQKAFTAISLIKSRKFQNSFRFWSYIFQLESVRSIQANKIILTKDKEKQLPSEIIYNINIRKELNYQNYLFSLHILKQQKILLNAIINQNSFKGLLCSNVSGVVEEIITEYKKQIFFVYNSFFLRHNHLRFNGKILFYPKLPSTSLGLYVKNSISVEEAFTNNLKLNNSYMFFEIFISETLCIEKLRTQGYFHRSKFRPIGNSKYISLTDTKILRHFGYVCNIFVDWYRCCYNISTLRRIILMLKESCCLTICRKHNKHRSWSYNIFTKDLLLISMLSASKKFFPNLTLVTKLKRKILNGKSNVIFNERFFLSNSLIC